MAAFKFRLEKVLNVRQMMEESAKQEWAMQERLAREERLKLAHLRQQEQEIKDYGYEQSDIETRQAMYSFLDILKVRIDRQIERLNEQERITSQAKEAWLLARQETKKVTTLREKQYASFIKEEERKEQKVLDDMRSHLES
ncbi:MAG TPA: flagellar export protein FliJ [Firmicutes bacterium]|jgi:flagellar FliJ protein|nr:flagellar export protein FliJ [Bacillota bacterium]